MPLACDAFRLLVRRPAFTLASMAALVVGVGAATLAYSLATALLLRPLPVDRADELVAQALSRPRIRVNQLGYPPAGPKTATWITDSDETHVFRLESGRGTTSLTGRSRPVPGIDGSSGFSVQLLDFSDLRHPGPYRVVSDDDPAAASVPFDVSPDPYRALFEDALRFFYAQRSGCRRSG